MTTQGKIKDGDNVEAPTGLALLRAPFPSNMIAKLPKPTEAQTKALKADFKVGIRCKECGGWHHPKVVHLDYVGHAALTDRLLDADPSWNWEPVAMNEDGTPKIDQFGGMWIKLTVCGVTRLGYGDAQGKTGPNAVKEVIGDALRNAAMRFGAALDLWHKGDLHADDPTPEEVTDKKDDANPKPKDDGPSKHAVDAAKKALECAESLDDLRSVWSDLPKPIQASPLVIAAKDARKAKLEQDDKVPERPGEGYDDEIPY